MGFYTYMYNIGGCEFIFRFSCIVVVVVLLPYEAYTCIICTHDIIHTCTVHMQLQLVYYDLNVCMCILSMVHVLIQWDIQGSIIIHACRVASRCVL